MANDDDDNNDYRKVVLFHICGPSSSAMIEPFGDPSVQDCVKPRTKASLTTPYQGRIRGGALARANHQYRKNHTKYLVITRNWLCFSLSIYIYISNDVFTASRADWCV